MWVADYLPGTVVGFDARDRAIVLSDLSGRQLVCLSPCGHLRVGDAVTFVQAGGGEAVCVLPGDPRAPRQAR